jgi:hypothetical protein
MFRNLPQLLLHTLHSLVRLCAVAAVMLVVGWILDKALSASTFAYLSTAQARALGAVEAINPLQMKDRYLCALTPSFDSMNRSMPRTAFQIPVAGDCMYTLADTAPSPGAPPVPVVGHWADGMSGYMIPFVAFLDMAWHMVFQHSIFASLFSLAAFLIGALVTGVLMMLPRFTWHPFIGASVFAVGTVAVGCGAAWCIQMLMEGGLYLFGSFTHFAGLCCGSAGIGYAGFALFSKTIEVRVHESVEHLVPH